MTAQQQINLDQILPKYEPSAIGQRVCILKGSKIWGAMYGTPKAWGGGHPRSVPTPPVYRPPCVRPVKRPTRTRFRSRSAPCGPSDLTHATRARVEAQAVKCEPPVRAGKWGRLRPRNRGAKNVMGPFPICPRRIARDGGRRPDRRAERPAITVSGRIPSAPLTMGRGICKLITPCQFSNTPSM